MEGGEERERTRRRREREAKREQGEGVRKEKRKEEKKRNREREKAILSCLLEKLLTLSPNNNQEMHQKFLVCKSNNCDLKKLLCHCGYLQEQLIKVVNAWCGCTCYI